MNSMTTIEATDGEDKPKAPEDENEISAMLKKSKAEGEKRRRRITTTCTVAGSSGTVIGLVIHRAPFFFISGIEASGHPAVFVGLAIMFGSFSVLLLGVLPSDVKAIRIAHRLIAFQIAVIGISSALVTVSWLKRGLEGDLPRMHRAHWLATVNVNCWLQLARLIKASYLSQRERLDQVWRIFGQFLMTTGILFFASSWTRPSSSTLGSHTRCT